MVSPHGVQRNADFMGHELTIPSPRRVQQGAYLSPLAAALAFFQGGEDRKWMGGLGSDLRRLEHRTGPTRIWVDPQQQKFGSNGPEVDDPANERLRAIVVSRIGFSAASDASSGMKIRSIGSLISLSMGSRVTTQPDRLWPELGRSRATRRVHAALRRRPPQAAIRRAGWQALQCRREPLHPLSGQDVVRPRARR